MSCDAVADESHQSQHGGDPDWEQLAVFEPARDRIRCFLSARDKHQAAEERLSGVLDEIHAGLKEDAEAMVQIGADFHSQHDTTRLAIEEDIQYHIMNNHKRRGELEKRLEESAKHAQGLFANLLARVSHGL